jgi:geranylgeranylglycerol-phosphate geranylgeranyltransferase
VHILRAILRLTRLDSSLLGFLTLFVPLLVRTHDLSFSLGMAIPLLFICMCTFVANDLDDLERDEINHPDRPLPMHTMGPTAAVVVYFSLLAAALFSTRHFVEARTAFWYYALITLSLSYGYVVEFAGGIKSLYVSAVMSIPVVVLARLFPAEPRLYLMAGAVFLLALGRELCMDIRDRSGDDSSFMHRLRPKPLAVAAFGLQAAGLSLLVAQARSAGAVLAIILMALLVLLAGASWFRLGNERYAITAMKLQFFVGLYLLT